MKQTMVFLFVLVLLVSPAFPQASTATVSGTVRDRTGAAIPAVGTNLDEPEPNRGSHSPQRHRGCGGQAEPTSRKLGPISDSIRRPMNKGPNHTAKKFSAREDNNFTM